MSEHVVPAGDPDRLDRILAAVVAGLSRGAARRLIAAGAVFLNGRRCQVASRLVRPGDRLRIESVPVARPSDAPLAIVFEDADMLAVDKPAGMPSAPTRRAASGTALEALRGQLRARDGRSATLWSVHRLDAPTSGLLLFAKTRQAAAALADAFQRQAVAKTYLALVDAPPAADAGIIDAPIRTDGGRAAVAADGRPALTEWRVLRREGSRALLELRPRSGRMHQLRVHLASIGHPVVGDRTYGGSPARRLMLHAAVLELPWRGRNLRLEARLPAELDPGAGA